MGRKRMDHERGILHKCKSCTKEFKHEWHIKYCPECYTKERKKRTIEFFRKNGHWKTKLRWREKLTICEVDAPTKEEWNTTYNPEITTEICSKCGEVHEKGKMYFHPFMQKIKSFGIEITDLEDLIKEILKSEKKEPKQILEEIGLEKGQLILEELKE